MLTLYHDTHHIGVNPAGLFDPADDFMCEKLARGIRRVDEVISQSFYVEAARVGATGLHQITQGVSELGVVV